MSCSWSQTLNHRLAVQCCEARSGRRTWFRHPQAGLLVGPGGARILWPSLPAACDRAQEDPDSEPKDDEIDDHLPGYHEPRRLGLGGDVAEADCGEHGHGEVQRVRAGHGLAETAGGDRGHDDIGGGEQQHEQRDAGGEGSMARRRGNGDAMIDRT